MEAFFDTIFVIWLIGGVIFLFSRLLSPDPQPADHGRPAAASDSPPSEPPNPPELEHAQEPPTMPRGVFTYTGRLPGHEPAQAMKAFFSASSEHERPSYEEKRDGWMFDGGGYWIFVGCFVEPDGTPVIALTSVSKSAHSNPPMEPFMSESGKVLQSLAHSTNAVLPIEEIAESGEHGTLRQLRPSELAGDPPNRMKEEVIWPALNHQFPGQWEEFMPDGAAGFVSEGVGVVVTYPNSEYFKVATIVLTGLQISTELLEELTELNVKLPIGGVFLSSGQNSWVAVWNFQFRSDWLDPSSQATRQMMLDVLGNASNMTNMAAESLRAKECGGRPFAFEPNEEVGAWGLVVMSQV